MREKLNTKRLLKVAMIALSTGIITMLILLLVAKHFRISWMSGVCIAIYYLIFFALCNYEHKKWWIALLVSLCFSVLTLIPVNIITGISTVSNLITFVILSAIYFPIILSCFKARNNTAKDTKRTRKPKEWRKYETVNDILDPTEKETLAIKAAKWWSDNLNIYSNKESTGDNFSDALLMFARTKTSDLTKSTINKFEVNLVRAISESTENDLTLRTDYAPCGILWELAKELKISHNYFPQKFTMRINFNQNKVYVRYAHDPEWDEI